MAEYEVSHHTGDNRYDSSLVYRPCESCGKTFRARIWKSRPSLGRYCSPRCKGDGMRRLPVLEERPCKVCGKIFIPSQHPNGNPTHGKFCSPKCVAIGRRKQVEVQCYACGKPFMIETKRGVRPGLGREGKYCSDVCFDSKQGVRVGLRKLDPHGYVLVQIPDHPLVLARKSRGSSNYYVREHRLVMEEILGRYLHPWENVHHKDGNKQNNEPDNLELWTVNQPAGQANVYLNEILQLRRQVLALEQALSARKGL